ncbi:MAG: carbohydrate ABC transporter substrate-binding protein [Hoeflea sp.]|uniref:carbohydrate ABC transporter substrate-binding protein n=1 Tax=Hoeflea sp. TaxID=1940281 RepID=UPI002730F264|nr:carbohydrate ABC transporter substrate-binding protein [Hoeflea sp.]MDP2118846.1 carbohydrate ABC transporter substrate-binding protein [Hoeflea sp.]
MTGIKLKGMTWSHPRGYDPMVACAQVWKEQTGVEIDWDKRSLQDFESFPVEELARQYDLIVIDHPHVGEITAQACLAALDVPGREAERAALAAGSIGGSYQSYTWEGRQWAFPVDAAAQVQAYRPDLIDAAPSIWDAMLDLAKQGRVLLPLRPPHSLMCFFTLAANLGTPCATQGPGELIAVAEGETIYGLLSELAGLCAPGCFDMDPIAVFEQMSRAESEIACAPLIYGYVNYGIAGFRDRRIGFGDIPAAGQLGPAGSALGGTGIAVSAFCKDPAAAIDFAYWVASGEVQRGPFARAGGQPGHAKGWEDDAVNAATNGFYRNTRTTLDRAWIRPRHRGYMAFQEAASERLNKGVKGGEAGARVVTDINRLFADSFG